MASESLSLAEWAAQQDAAQAPEPEERYTLADWAAMADEVEGMGVGERAGLAGRRLGASALSGTGSMFGGAARVPEAIGRAVGVPESALDAVAPARIGERAFHALSGEAAGEPPQALDVAGSWVETKGMDVLGSTVPIAVTGVLTGGVGVAAAGALMQADQQYQEAVESGLDPNDPKAWAAFVGGGLIGSAEGAAGVGKVLAQVNKRSGGAFRAALLGLIEEPTQELGAQVASNILARHLYDEEREVLEGAKDALEGGLFAAVVFGALGAPADLLARPGGSGGGGLLQEPPSAPSPEQPAPGKPGLSKAPPEEKPAELEVGSFVGTKKGVRGRAVAVTESEVELEVGEGKRVRVPRKEAVFVTRPPDKPEAVKGRKVAPIPARLAPLWEQITHELDRGYAAKTPTPVEPVTKSELWVKELVERRGGDVIFVDSGGPSVVLGANIKGKSALIFDVSRQGESMRSIAVHELAHYLREQARPAWDSLREFIQREAPDALRIARAEFEGRYRTLGTVNEDLLQNEEVSHTVQEIAAYIEFALSDKGADTLQRAIEAEPTFWRSVLDWLIEAVRKLGIKVGETSAEESARELENLVTAFGSSLVGKKLELDAKTSARLAIATREAFNAVLGKPRPKDRKVKAPRTRPLRRRTGNYALREEGQLLTDPAMAPDPEGGALQSDLALNAARNLGPGESVLGFGGDGLPNETTRDWLRRKAQDKMLRWKKLQRAMTEAGARIPESADVYGHEELYHGKVANGLRVFEREEVNPILEHMGRHKISQEDANEYLYARHAPRRNEVIAERSEGKFDTEVNPGSGMSDSEAAELVAFYEQQEGYRELGQLFDQLNERTMDRRTEYGLLSLEEAEGWREVMGPHYAPLRTDQAEGTRLNIGKGFNIRGKESKRARGRTSLADNILANAINQASEAIVRGEKNLVLQRVAHFVRRYESPDGWAITKGEGANPQRDEHGNLTGPYIEQHGAGRSLADRTVSFKEDGEHYAITFTDPLLARALKNLGGPQAGKVMDAASLIMRAYSKLQTSWNYAFVVSNLLRDLQTAAIHLYGEKGAKVAFKALNPVRIASSMRGIHTELRSPGKSSHKYAKLFRELSAAGGRTDWFYTPSTDERVKAIERAVAKADPSKPRDALDVIRALGELVEDVNSSIENAVRLTAYEALLETGAAQFQAARVAKNLTVNFNRRGEWGHALNLLYVFYNASIQGTFRMFGALRNPKVRGIATTIAASGFGLTLYNMMAAGEDDDGVNRYEKIPDWIKERNLIVWLPNHEGEASGAIKATPDGKHYYLQVPLPWGYNVFHALGAYSAESAYGDRSWLDTGKAMVGATIGAFNPIGSESSIWQVVSPTFTDPIVQVAENETFYGTPIKPEAFPGDPTPQHQLYWNSVSPVSRRITAWLYDVTGGNRMKPWAVDVSPEWIDHWTDFLMGGAGRSVKRTVEAPMRYAMGEDVPIREIPIVRRLLGEPSESWTAYAFFDSMAELREIKRRVEDNQKEGNVADARYLMVKNAAKLRLIPAMTSFKNAVNDMRRKEAPEERIREVQEQWNRLWVEAQVQMGERRERR